MIGALPARFRRSRVLVVGCGDVGQRALSTLRRGAQVLALVRSEASAAACRARGVRPLRGDLADGHSLHRLAGVATEVIYLAPPVQAVADGSHDQGMRHWIQAMRRRLGPSRVVYVSTSGVYGDRAGAWVDERDLPQPRTLRAQRRVDAERQLRAAWPATVVLRAPGIYALDRADGGPRRRLEAGAPVLCPEEDVYTNHIHADDLARACHLARRQRARGLTFNVNDDSQWTVGEYWAVAAAALGYPPPPQVTWAQAQAQLSPMVLSFWSESRRLRNARMKRVLGLQLRYPTAQEGLAQA